MNPRLILLHCRADLLQHLREPGYLTQVLVFPVMFFLFFGVAAAEGSVGSNLVFASYATYAFMGVAIIQYTGGIARGRIRMWDEYLRTLPASFSHRMLGWSLSGLVVGIVASMVVAVAAVLTTEVRLGAAQWLFLSAAVLYGSVAMALIAACIGYWLQPGVALPVATLAYFMLTYAGGIWMAPDDLPGWVQELSPALPSRLWVELAWASVREQPWEMRHWLGLAGYIGIAALFARWGYSRELARRRRRTR